MENTSNSGMFSFKTSRVGIGVLKILLISPITPLISSILVNGTYDLTREYEVESNIICTNRGHTNST